ncbi:MAG: 5'-nucleotidase C-terminal domain-containing protein [Pseudomonadota bacterium]
MNNVKAPDDITMLMNQAFNPDPVKGQTMLRILATTDLHMWMLGYDYYLDEVDQRHSLARLAPLIEQRRREAPNVCLLDNGDLLQGTPMAEVLVEDWASGLNTAHPVMQTLTRLGYDAAGLGNHDFNFGLPYLDAAIESAGFPVVCANAVRRRGKTPDTDIPYFNPYTLIAKDMVMADGTTQGLGIGIIGLLPPQIVDWDRVHLKDQLETRSIVQAARYHVPRLRAAGADVVIALCHSGLGASLSDQAQENAGLALSTVQGIDAIVLGHVHRTFPETAYADYEGVDLALGTLCGTPTVMPGFWGSHLGVIDLGLEFSGGKWTVVDHASCADPVDKVATVKSGQPDLSANAADTSLVERRNQGPKNADPLDPVQSAGIVGFEMDQAHQRTLDLIRKPVGSTKGRLHSYFGEIGPTPVENLIRDAKLAKCQTLVQTGRLPELPILSMTSPFKSGGFSGPDYYTDIPRGDLALRHVADIYLFPNTFVVLRRTGQQIIDLITRTAGLLAHIPSGTHDTPLLSMDQPHYTLDWVHGLTYTIDLAQRRASERVVEVALNGHPLPRDRDVLLATNNYRVAISETPVAPKDILFDDPIAMRTVLMDYLSEAPNYVPDPQTPLTFKQFRDPTTCTMRIGPGARDLIDADDRMTIQDQTPDGFLHVQFSLSNTSA